MSIERLRAEIKRRAAAREAGGKTAAKSLAEIVGTTITVKPVLPSALQRLVEMLAKEEE